jgi:hypothetical protein
MTSSSVVKLKCSATGCGKEVHMACYQGLVLRKYNLEALESGAVCTKKCYDKFLKDSRSAEDSRGSWHNDGKKGPDDPRTSMSILLEWWLTEGNYSKYCGKNNGGVKKKEFAAKLAEKISNETSTKRDSKGIINKIRHIEDAWRRAHSFATSKTGAGIKENEGESTFQEAVKKICVHYYDLLEVMQDRASSRPKLTSYEADDDEDDDDGSDQGSEEEKEELVGGDDNSSVASGITTSTKQTSASNKKRKTGSSLMDGSAVAALTEGNKALKDRVTELARHNKEVELMEKRRFQLEENRLNLEQSRFQSMSWKGRNDELNYKMNLLSKYQEFKNLNWTDEQIVRFCPDMEQVIKAQSSPPPTQPSQEEDDLDFAFD